MKKKSRNQLRKHRKKRIRKKLAGTSKCPRLCVFRSNTAIYLQLIDDEKAITLAEADSRTDSKKGFNIDAAAKTGKRMAEMVKKVKAKSILFDRGGYRYHGKVKAVADALRKEGIKF